MRMRVKSQKFLIIQGMINVCLIKYLLEFYLLMSVDLFPELHSKSNINKSSKYL